MQSKTRRKNSKKRWIGRVLQKSVAPVEPMPKHRCIRWLSEDPTPWCLWGTGWTDGITTGIGVLGILCSKDDVKRPGEDPSAPDEPMITVSAVRSSTATSGYEWPDEPTLPQPEASVHPMIRRFSADRWSNCYKTWWPIYVSPRPFEGCWSC